MSHIENIIRDIKYFMYGGIISLPLTIGGTMTILGLFTANYAMLFFLLGFLIITPISSYIINTILILIISKIGTFSNAESTQHTFMRDLINYFNNNSADICKLSVPYKTIVNEPSQEFIASSTWVAMITFFIGYILKNAIELYSRESPDLDSDVASKVNTRKYQSIISIVSIILFAIVIFGYRLYTGCESKVGIILTSLIFIPLGFSWYKALASVGQDRLSDLFGIANRLLSPTAIIDEPIACVPSK